MPPDLEDLISGISGVLYNNRPRNQAVVASTTEALSVQRPPAISLDWETPIATKICNSGSG